MIKKLDIQIRLLKSAFLLMIFLIFTDLLMLVNVKPIGPDNTKVGFAAINQFFRDKIGTSSKWFLITDKIVYLAIFLVFVFAAIGIIQLIKRKNIKLVDSHIIALGITYIVTILFYFIFEKIVINYRPVKIFLDDTINEIGVLEASYPSTHTLIAVIFFITAAIEASKLITSEKYKIFKIVIYIYCGIMLITAVIGRLLSGVHWFTDIVGSLLLSAYIINLYYLLIFFIDLIKEKFPPKKSKDKVSE